jgi:ribonuclease R
LKKTKQALMALFNKKPKKLKEDASWREQDPFQNREAERYVEPIASREYILKVLTEAKNALQVDDLLLIFGLTGERDKDGLRRRLRAMERDQQLVLTEAGGYRPFKTGEDVSRTATPLKVDNSVKVNLEIAVNLALEHHELPHEWSPDLLREIKTIKTEIDREEIAKRRDLRDLPLVTIDGEDAKDFDDAVYCERAGDDYRLIVAIADVSYYVRFGSALDKEAEVRGTSTYFPKKVIPMLPEILSNELCSLKPEVDRLCLVADMRIDREGHLLEFEFYEAVMRSKARLTYSQVAKVLEHPELMKEAPYNKFTHVWTHIFDLYALFKVLYQAREARGALDFDTVEGVLMLNEQGELTHINPVVRNDAHKLIEEAMLIANVAAARLLDDSDVLGIYRVHEGLREEKYPDLRDFLSSRGLKLARHIPTAKELNEVLVAAHDRADFSVLQTVVLRSMTQAIYSPNNVGHYGLAYDTYTHFTSPIRRYPDLLVHRLIRKVLSAQDKSGRAYDAETLEALCMHTSMTERRADEASREVVMMLKCGLLQQHLGKEFTGIISSVTHFGLFVTLEEWLVDGLVHVTSLPADYYQFDPVHHALQGERSGRKYQIGQEIKVKVVKVDPIERKVDFYIAGYEQTRKRPQRRGPKKPGANKKNRKVKP